MAQMICGATRRINRAEEIEMHIPFPRLAILIEEVQHCPRPSLLVKPTTTVPVIRKQPREVIVCGECRLNQRPGAKREPNTVKTVDVLHASHHMPESLRAHPIQKQQQPLLLVFSQIGKCQIVPSCPVQPDKFARERFPLVERKIAPTELPRCSGGHYSRPSVLSRSMRDSALKPWKLMPTPLPGLTYATSPLTITSWPSGRGIRNNKRAPSGRSACVFM